MKLDRSLVYTETINRNEYCEEDVLRARKVQHIEAVGSWEHFNFTGQEILRSGRLLAVGGVCSVVPEERNSERNKTKF